MRYRPTIEKMMITVGLPGSGKTTWTDEYQAKSRRGVQVYHFDNVTRSKTEDSVTKFDSILWETVIWGDGPVIVDGLFVNNKEYDNLIMHFLRMADIDEIELHYWKPDIDKCLWNDMGRRTQSSAVTIRTLKVEEPDIDMLSKKYNVKMKIVYHDIVRKSEFQQIADECNTSLYEDRYICSDTWCLGGTYTNYGGDVYPIHSEEPKEFTELDDFLENKVPDLKATEYRRIKKECVEIKEDNDDDYYSKVKVACWVCDVPKMLEILDEYGYSINWDE